MDQENSKHLFKDNMPKWEISHTSGGSYLHRKNWNKKIYCTCDDSKKLFRDRYYGPSENAKVKEIVYSHFLDDWKEETEELQSDQNLYFGKSAEQQTRLKLRTWEQYKTLRELSKCLPKQSRLNMELTNLTLLTKVRIGRKSNTLRPLVGNPIKKTAIKTKMLRTVLTPSYTYVRFRNFKSNKLYKRIIILKNVGIFPVKFQIERRPIYPQFTVLIEYPKNSRCSVLPGMHLKIIILFCSDILEDSEDVLILNVQYGKPVIIKLHGYRDPPVLKVTEEVHLKITADECLCFNGEKIESAIYWHPNTNSPNEFRSLPQNSYENMESIAMNLKKCSRVLFDCKQSFVGEQIYVPLTFKNVGGNGRFFLLSEIDWSLMHIEDITDTNMLILPCFTLWPVYFSLKSQEEICLHTYFFPVSSGMHVDKLHLVCDNCTKTETEVIGDGIMYETSFIQISKQFEKTWPIAEHTDKHALYYVQLNAVEPNGNCQCVISVCNISEIAMYFRWKKRDVQRSDSEMDTKNHFPLELIEIIPSHGILPPNSVRNFTVCATLWNLPANDYCTVLQLYVEDIPLAAISKKMRLHTETCQARRRSCLTSVDIWVADIEIWLQSESTEKLDNFNNWLFMSEQIGESYNGEINTQTIIDECGHYIEGETNQQQITVTLTEQEIFSYCDLINCKEVESVITDNVTSYGTMRVTKPLYIGTEETYSLIIKNTSNQSLTYTWGKSIGEDKTKLNLHFYPMVGKIPVGGAQDVKITLIPIHQGTVRLEVPCYVGQSQQIIMLKIRCSIEPFFVTFYFPSEESSELYNHFIHVEWHAQKLNSVPSFAGKQWQFKVKDHQIQKINPVQENYGKFICLKQYKDLIPFDKVISPTTTQPIVIKFLNVPLKKVRKKTFLIKNETLVSSSVQSRIKNFQPLNSTCGRKIKKEHVRMIYRTTFHHHNNRNIEEKLSHMKQSEFGTVIFVDPLDSHIGPYKVVPIDIYVYADTWGIYVDELEINISGLPQYTIGIYIEVVGLPISLPIRDSSKTFIYRFGSMRYGTPPKSRKILITNTSVLPISINWYTFLVEPKISEPMPFNIVLDTFTLFTNELRSNLMIGMREELNNSLRIHSNEYKYEKKSKILNTCDSSSDPNTKANKTYKISDEDSSLSSASSVTWCTLPKELENVDNTWHFVPEVTQLSNQKHTYRKGVNVLSEIDHRKFEKRETEIQISIVPYYGLPHTKVCTIYPKEVFIRPGGISYITITVHPDECSACKGQQKLFCKILGIIRISPMDKYKDYSYLRMDGYSLKPVEIDVIAQIIKSRLVFDISKAERTFTFCCNDIMHNPKKQLETKKTYFFYNNNDNAIHVRLNTQNPFHVGSVLVNGKPVPQKRVKNLWINANRYAQVEVICTVDKELLKKLVNTTKSQDILNSAIVLKEPLCITHSDNTNQVLELILKMILPSLELSTYTLNFGPTYVGDTKKLTIVITNLSACRQNLKITKKLNNNEFILNNMEGELQNCSITERSSLTVTVFFMPKNPGQSIETLEITTGVSNVIEECILNGEGTLNAKHCYPHA